MGGAGEVRRTQTCGAVQKIACVNLCKGGLYLKYCDIECGKNLL